MEPIVDTACFLNSCALQETVNLGYVIAKYIDILKFFLNSSTVPRVISLCASLPKNQGSFPVSPLHGDVIQFRKVSIFFVAFVVHEDLTRQ